MYKDQPPLVIDGALVDPNIQKVIRTIVDYINARPPEDAPVKEPAAKAEQ